MHVFYELALEGTEERVLLPILRGSEQRPDLNRVAAAEVFCVILKYKPACFNYFHKRFGGVRVIGIQ